MPTFNTTISFTPEEVEEILKKYVAQELKMSGAISVNFKVSSRTLGYGPGEYTSNDLTSVEVSGKMER